ncbi:hypothetical protein AB0G74_04115 [Streptomyces sp. NPDC020875]|uniref:DUF1963 domain-containing protein n=1 Tax=Streptomyces sp. NPDC020875 TaxID=3154898 RepID=UPI0033E3828F
MTLDIARILPELAPLARRTTALRPKRGAPTPYDSSLGGPPLWPGDTPWPVCDRPDHHNWDDSVPPGPVPMVPVLQLFARDVPGLPFPDGTDVLQLLWCALLHPDEPSESVRPVLHWRTESAIAPSGTPGDVPRPAEGEYDPDFLPDACVLAPVECVDYPHRDLPEELVPLVLRAEEEFGFFLSEFGVLESKVGGYPAWTQPPDWPYCAAGHRMDHLLSVTGDEELRMDMGDAGGVYLFVCTECPGMPYASRYDCH